MAQAPLIIVSGPSGSGKSTLIARVLKDSGFPLRLSVSATTRKPRPGERDGVHYWFWTRQQFQDRLQAGEFLEWAEVHSQCYGTLRREVDEYRQRGIGVLLDIDVQGAEQIRSRYPDCLTIFIQAPSWEAYGARLRKRGTESEEKIAQRLATAKRELERVGEFDCVVVNDDPAIAAEQLRERIAQAFAKRER